MSRPARPTGGAPAGARRRSRSATARTRARHSRRSSGKPATAEKVWFCTCKRSANKPMCDGSHKTAVDQYHARSSARIVLRGNPGAHAGAGGGGFAQARHRPAGRAGLVYEGAKAFVTPRRLALAVQGMPARQPDVREEKKGPRVGAPEDAIAGFLKAAGLASISEAKVAARQEGRLLRRGDREAGPRRHRCDRRDLARGDQDLPVAEVDALGRRASNRAGRAQLGAAAAFDRRDVRAGDRGAGDRAASRSTALRPATRPAATASWRRRRSRCAGSTIIWRSSTRPRSCSTPSAAREIILTDAKKLAFAQGFELVEDEGCWPKSPAWSNGRWC